jgi:hypothetical protein
MLEAAMLEAAMLEAAGLVRAASFTGTARCHDVRAHGLSSILCGVMPLLVLLVLALRGRRPSSPPRALVLPP